MLHPKLSIKWYVLFFYPVRISGIAESLLCMHVKLNSLKRIIHLVKVTITLIQGN